MNLHTDLLLWQAEHLFNAKQRLAQTESRLQPAYAKLLRDADKALTAGPFSVLDKPMTPLAVTSRATITSAPTGGPIPIPQMDYLTYAVMER